MTYNPSVNDRSGEILANAQNAASLAYYQGMQDLGQGIKEGADNIKQAALAVATGGASAAATRSSGGGGSSSGSGNGFLSSMIQSSREKTAKLEGIQATGQALMDILPTYGKEGMALAEALSQNISRAGNNPDKMAGAMMPFMPAVENLQSRYNQQAQYDAALELHRQKQALGLGGGSGSAAESGMTTLNFGY